ncbi:O-antigen polysaccharide polymerase Wzy [Candidatus Uabimicrobium sp. HlEnr_7]|uniref:O-antigen polysaccharide polymerase Wzy n=1 Tax=Candidatus Uabimicrobium helgolandensis TaxID=3095367 RepID=UPI0035572B46
MNRKNSNLPGTLIHIFVLLFTLLLINFMSPIFSLFITSWLVVIIFILAISYNHFILKMHLLSFPQVYLAVTFIFTSGTLLLYALGMDTAFDKFKWFDEFFLIKANELVFLSIVCFQLGLHFPIVSSKFSDNDFDYSFLRVVALTLFITSCFLLIFVYPSFLTIMLKSGYQNFVFFRQQNDVRIPITILHWLLPLTCIILACTCESSQQRKTAYVTGAITCTMFLLTGDRGGCFSFLLAFLVSVRLSGKVFSNFRIILLALSIIFIIPILFELRNLNDFQIDNPFEKALQETGSSLQVLLGTMMIIPETENYMYGEAYLSAVQKIIPNLGSWKASDEVTLSLWIKNYMNPERSGLGFLKIAEAYSQFGIIGVCVVFLLFGIWMSSWFIKLEQGKKNTYDFAWKSFSFYIVLIWIRNHAVVSVRPIIWTFLLLLVIKFFAKLIWKQK